MKFTLRLIARKALSAGTTVIAVGHKTEAIYRRYTIVNDADLQDAAKKLAAVGASER